MTHAAWLLAFLLAAPAAADKDKDKDKDKKKPEAAAKVTVSVEDLVRQADEKLAAGDAAGGQGAPPEGRGHAHRDRRRLAAPRQGARRHARPRRGDGCLPQRGSEADRPRQGRGARPAGPRRGDARERRDWPPRWRRRRPPTRTGRSPRSRWPAPGPAKARETRPSPSPRRPPRPGPTRRRPSAARRRRRNALPEAEAAYRAAGGAEGTNLLATVGLARVLRRTGRAAEALPLLEKAIASAPGAVAAYKESARVKIAIGRGADAVGDAATAAALAETRPRGQARLPGGDGGQGPRLRRAEPGRPGHPGPHRPARREPRPGHRPRRPGPCLRAPTRQADLAIVELQKAVQLDPNNAEAQYQLGYVEPPDQARRRGRRRPLREGGRRSSRPTPNTARSSGPRWPRPTCPTARWPS